VEATAKVGSVYGISDASNNDNDDVIDVDDLDNGELLEMRRLLKTINRNGDQFLSCLDVLVQEEKKSEGRLKAHLEKKKEDVKRNEELDVLDNIGNITSTKLAVNGRFHLNEQLRDKFRKDRFEKNEDNNRKKRKKEIEKENEQKRFDVAAPKFIAGKPLTRDDLSTLLHRIQEKGKDSPVKTNKPDLLEQMQRRYDRVCEYLDPTRKKQRVSQAITEDTTTGLDILTDVMMAKEENELFMRGTTNGNTNNSGLGSTSSSSGVVEPPGGSNIVGAMSGTDDVVSV
jgi:hypothetical protein